MGYGRSINIWFDFWLSGRKELQQYQPIGAPIENPKQVCSLINRDTQWWDTDLVQRLFPPWIVVGIFKLFLPSESQQDVMFWERERSGTYNVKSGYCLIKQHELNSMTGESFSALQERKLWRHIWQRRAPNRVKIFAWRFDQDNLPTHGKLACRRILDEDKCSFCQARTKDLHHAIFECLEISIFWKQLMPQNDPLQLERSPLKLLHHYLNHCLDQFECLITISWGLW